MQVTEIEVKFGMTVNVGDYSNVRPEVSMRVALNPADDPGVALHTVFDEVHNKIRSVADEELQMHGREPQYTDMKDLYVAPMSYRHKAVALFPASLQGEVSAAGMAGAGSFSGNSSQRTLSFAQKLYAERCADRPDYQHFDCSDGDLSELLAYIADKEEEIQIEEERRKQEREEQQRRWEAEREAARLQADADEYDDDDDDDYEEDDYDKETW